MESVWEEAWPGALWVAGVQVATCTAGRCSEKKPGVVGVLLRSWAEEGVESEAGDQGIPVCPGAWETVGGPGTGSEHQESENALVGGTA